jgi:hypothetical protein
MVAAVIEGNSVDSVYTLLLSNMTRKMIQQCLKRPHFFVVIRPEMSEGVKTHTSTD